MIEPPADAPLPDGADGAERDAHVSPARPAPRAGDRVGPYRLVRLLGEGTGGRVFEVVHDKLDRRAALKLLDAAGAMRPSTRARFFAEALSINRINHPHIVEVTDIVETTAQDGLVAGLVMELLEGQSLGAAVAAEGPQPPERFLPNLPEVCEALAAAHPAGFVHRDLKPENVFLCDRHGASDFVKLLDFGVAAPLARTRTGLGGAAPGGAASGAGGTRTSPSARLQTRARPRAAQTVRGHAGLRVAGAGLGSARRPHDRPLRRGRHALRARLWPPAVRGLERG